MVAFSITGANTIDLRATNLNGFDGLTFNTSGAATAQVNTSQFGGAGLPLNLTITGNGAFADALELFLGAGTTFTAAGFAFATWSPPGDLLVFRDTAGANETITGSGQDDRMHVTGGTDTVDGGLGSNDLLTIDWTGDPNNFGMNGGGQITDFANTGVTFSNIERFDITLGEGNDNVTLLGGDDRLIGGGGDDTLNTAAGAAIVDGGSGNDIWAANLSAFSGAFTLNLNTAGLQNIGNGSSVNNIEGMSVTGGSAGDTFITKTTNGTNDFNETLAGGDGNDTLGVGGGTDTVDGGLGSNDLLTINWTGDPDNFGMNGGGQITDFANTNVTFSNIERFNITLGSGNDSVVLLGGDDTANGGGGNDTLNTAAGAAIVDGGSGNDIWAANLSAFSGAFTLNLNTAGLQNIGNGSSVNNIEGLSITTGSGNDTLISRTTNGTGDINNSIASGDGNDTIGVGGGTDTVDGGLGSNDLLTINWTGDPDNFGMNGGGQITDFANTNVTFSNIERFNITLGSGNDSVVLLGGDDTANGGGGNDTLNTAAGAAIVDGGSGRDFWIADLSAFAGAFTLNLNTAGLQNIGNGSSVNNIEGMSVTGGSAGDTFITKTTNGTNDFNETLAGGDGNDTLGVGGGTDTVDGGLGSNDLLVIDWTGDPNNFGMNGGGQITDFANTGVTFSNIERFNITLGSGNDSVILLGGDDTANGGAGNDTLNTAAGAAIVDGGSGADFWIADLSAFAGAFALNLNTVGLQNIGNASSVNNIEGMSVTGGSGNDTLISKTTNGTNDFNETLAGGDGNDTLGVGGGTDTVDGGLGSNDLLVIDWTGDPNNFGMNGGSQITDFANTNVTFSNIERFDVTTGSGADNIALLGGNDIVRLGSGNNSVDLGGGDDLAIAGAGNDVFNGNSGADTADYRNATSGVTASLLVAGAQSVGGGLGTSNLIAMENLTGGGFADVLTGNGDANTLNGGAGNDSLDGGLGNDTLGGGLGNDSLIGGAGSDTADFSAAAGPITVNLTLAGPQNTGEGLDTFSGIENLIGSAFDDTFTGQNLINRFDGGGGADELRGGSGNDILNGDAGADLIIADAGNDTISGGTEVDRLYGGSGNDTIFGGAGADTLVGGPGVDRLDGGADPDRLYADGTADTFVFGNGAGDRIFSFVSGLHDIEIDASAFGGAAGAFAFAQGATPTPGSALQALLYDTDDGKLYFDADGNGAGARVHVLTLFGAPTLVAGDIVLV